MVYLVVITDEADRPTGDSWDTLAEHEGRRKGLHKGV